MGGVGVLAWVCVFLGGSAYRFAEDLRPDDVALHVEEPRLKFTADLDCMFRCLTCAHCGDVVRGAVYAAADEVDVH